MRLPGERIPAVKFWTGAGLRHHLRLPILTNRPADEAKSQHLFLAAEYRNSDAPAVPPDKLLVDFRTCDAATLKVSPDLLRQRLVILLRAYAGAVGECHALT